MLKNQAATIVPIKDVIFTVNGQDSKNQKGYSSVTNCLLMTAVKRQFAIDSREDTSCGGFNVWINGQKFSMTDKLVGRVRNMARCTDDTAILENLGKFKRFRVRVRMDKNGKGIAALA